MPGTKKRELGVSTLNRYLQVKFSTVECNEQQLMDKDSPLDDRRGSVLKEFKSLIKKLLIQDYYR